jgi:hypothetical protein
MHRVFISLPRDVDQARHGVEQPNVVSTLRQPERIRAGCATNVQNNGRRLRYVANDQLTAPRLLEAKHGQLQTRLFRRAIIVGADGRIEARWRLLGHVLLDGA